MSDKKIIWGLLGPEVLSSVRRRRTLGLARSVRRFNDLAVPGVGGVWYGKQLFLATLGIIVAERAVQRVSNLKKIKVANAIEALACLLALRVKESESDRRLRGREKLRGKDDNLSFSRVGHSNFYVTIPMRMSTVQALPALGFVTSDSPRFNAFASTNEGRQFVDMTCQGCSPFNRDVVSHLTMWVCDEIDNVRTNHLNKALSPCEVLNESSRRLLMERLQRGSSYESERDTLRRRNALAWVDSLRSNQGRNMHPFLQRPAEFDQAHWHDIEAGALFFNVQDLSNKVLDAIENSMGPDGHPCSFRDGVNVAKDRLHSLKQAASDFLNCGHADEDANRFCSECINEPQSTLRALVHRDQIVLTPVNDEIRKGPAFKGKVEDVDKRGVEDADTPAGRMPVPANVSYRLRNLYLLNLDLKGELGQWLEQNKNEEVAS